MPAFALRGSAVAACLVILTACATKPAEKPVEPIPTPPPPVTTAPPGPKSFPGKDLPPLDDSVIRIAAVGDMMLGTDYPKNILPDDDGVGFLKDVTPVLSAADVTFGNLEGVLMDGGEPVKVCKNPENCFLFRSPTRYAQYFRDAGFDVLSLANNHARDFGEEGRDSSMKALDAAGILHSGRQGDVAKWTTKGKRFVMIAFAPNLGAHQLNDLPTARELVKQLAAENDVVIVSFHGGAEGDGAERLTFAKEIFHEENRGNVVEFARAMVDAGADLVLGHGPHVVRAMELYHDRLIAYSLGNFATYYGISVTGNRGIAPILIASIQGDGKFVSAKLESTIQIRPGGPQVDPQHRVLKLIRGLTQEAFPDGQLAFNERGEIKNRALARADASAAAPRAAPRARGGNAGSPATDGT
jgi:poly-gamma-glutamate capsule biosynthesis protein CapA/YwtB (metallophosphatase superfamily)